MVATRGGNRGEQEPQWALDMVATPLLANPDELPQSIVRVIKSVGGAPIDFDAWVSSGYQPTPTVVEAPLPSVMQGNSLRCREIFTRRRIPNPLADSSEAQNAVIHLGGVKIWIPLKVAGGGINQPLGLRTLRIRQLLLLALS